MIQIINNNQFLASEENLKLTKLSLKDYIIETRANLALDKTKLSITDTLEDEKMKIIIIESIRNNGKRAAEDFEIRQTIVLKNGVIELLSSNNSIKEILPNELKEFTYQPTISMQDYESFFYWVQIKYYDVRLNKLTYRSKYLHYYKSPKGYDFYYVNTEQKSILRKIIDEDLKNKGLSLTID